MISKIVDIEGKEFGANAPDYMYKEYLELPYLILQFKQYQVRT